MLRNLDSTLGTAIAANDGEIGKTLDVLFDDRSWAVRYLVVAAGSWIARHNVLVSPVVLGKPNWAEHTFPVNLTREQVRSSPDINTDLPVSRQHELAVIAHYKWPDFLGPGPLFPPFPCETGCSPYSGTSPEEAGDPHLRSAKEVRGYHVNAAGGRLGEIVDFNVDDERWRILELVIKSQPSADRGNIVIPVRSVAEIVWETRSVRLIGGHADFAPAPLTIQA